MLQFFNSGNWYDALGFLRRTLRFHHVVAGFRQDMKELKMFKDTTIDNVLDKGKLLYTVMLS